MPFPSSLTGVVALLLLSNAAGVLVAIAWMKRRRRLRPEVEHPPIGTVLPFALAASFALFMLLWAWSRQLGGWDLLMIGGVPALILASATTELVRNRAFRRALVVLQAVIVVIWFAAILSI